MIVLEQYHAGDYVKDPSGYAYFLPSKINTAWTWQDPALNNLLEQAALKLGELNSYAKLVPNIDLFIRLHVTKEAVVSSRIEGTRTQIDEALFNEDDIIPERKNDWLEVNNYIKALNHGIGRLEQLPISTRLIKEIHKILLQNARGEQKLPGEFRTSQNWIGGSSLLDAVFVPPNHAHVGELMGDLEQFLHNDAISVPTLIKIAIAHYQFETIHPFLDGNGRIGRLLITLYLVDQKLLSQPLLYLSDFFEENKGLYYDNLTFVRTKHDMKQWLKYFLVGVARTAASASQTLSNVIHLNADLEHKIQDSFGKRTGKAIILLRYLFLHPVISVKEAEQALHISYKAANDLINEFLLNKILVEVTGYSRNRMFVFEHYLGLFRS